VRESTVTRLSALVAIERLRRNAYFATQAERLFAETTYLPVRPGAGRLERALEEHDVVIVGVREEISGSMLSARTRAKVVGTLSNGTDHLDVDALRRHGIAVITSPTGNARSVAEHNVALAFALAKRLKEGDLATAHGAGRGGLHGWPMELQGKTAGLIGYGRIGQATAKVFSALGLEVLATSRTRTTGADETATFVTLDRLLTEAHIIALAVPLTPATHHLLDAHAIDRIRPGALLINTCRPGLIDNEHVRECLAGGRLAGFGADYDEEEPGVWGNMPSVIVTPHIAGRTQEASDRVDNELIDRIRVFLTSAGW
jgi:phosphoglycerate dehydrogenase-like enzyme